jgi:hypothetical protein
MKVMCATVFAVLVLATAAACSSTNQGTAGTDSGVPPPAQCGGFNSTTNACLESCIVNDCCSLGTTCGNDQSCLDLFNCIKACATGDTTCTNNCDTTYSSAMTEYDNFLSCIGSDCGSCFPDAG